MATKKSKRQRARRKEHEKTSLFLLLGFIGLVLVVFSIYTVDRYSFVNGTFPLWYVALGIGVIVGAFVSWKFILKKHGVGKSIGLALIIAVTSFFVLGSAFTHLNHIFDFSEPERYTVVIENKIYKARGRRRISKKEFTITVNGETFDIGVPSNHFSSLEVGDLYIVEYHKGAFNAPYYIGVGGVLNKTDKERIK